MSKEDIGKGCISLATLKNKYGRPESGGWWCTSAGNRDNDDFVLTYQFGIKDGMKITLMKFSVKDGIPSVKETKTEIISYKGLDPPRWAKLYKERITFSSSIPLEFYFITRL